MSNEYASKGETGFCLFLCMVLVLLLAAIVGWWSERTIDLEKHVAYLEIMQLGEE